MSPEQRWSWEAGGQGVSMTLQEGVPLLRDPAWVLPRTALPADWGWPVPTWDAHCPFPASCLPGLDSHISQELEAQTRSRPHHVPLLHSTNLLIAAGPWASPPSELLTCRRPQLRTARSGLTHHCTSQPLRAAAVPWVSILPRWQRGGLCSFVSEGWGWQIHSRLTVAHQLQPLV